MDEKKFYESIEEIKVAHFQPGDIVIMVIKQKLSHEDAQKIGLRLEEIVGKDKTVLVFDEDVTMHIIRQSRPPQMMFTTNAKIGGNIERAVKQSFRREHQ